MTSGKFTSINARQIKAARALLDWSQEDLAGASGLSIATIRKIESGALSPRDKTMGAIVSALEEANIEFTDSTGVRLRSDVVTVIEGGSCFARLLDEIFYSLKGNPGEVLFMNADGGRDTEAEIAGHLRLKKAGVRYRILVEEGNTYLHFPMREFRWVPSKYFRYNVLAVFQDKVAICVYEKSINAPMNKVYIIHNCYLADAMKGSFDFLWDNCRKPTLTTAPQVFE